MTIPFYDSASGDGVDQAGRHQGMPHIRHWSDETPTAPPTAGMAPVAITLWYSPFLHEKNYCLCAPDPFLPWFVTFVLHCASFIACF